MPRSPAPADIVRRTLLVATAMAVSLVAYFVVTLLQVWSTGRDDSFAQGVGQVDALVVLGAAQYDGRPSPQLRARLNHALMLWQRDAAALIVVTGGKRAGDRFTEAETSRDYLIARGVPAGAIVVEPRGTSTFESLAAVRDDDVTRTLQRVVVVSDPYHVMRAQLVARELGFDATSSATRSGITRGTGALRRNMRESLGIMVGRITGFRQLEAWLQ
ncbi:MAG: YdcF family protein [Acidimicrobiaceae bacterium]|nr:YdcF family protein [Acidimicrobiaceae bacterium]